MAPVNKEIICVQFLPNLDFKEIPYLVNCVSLLIRCYRMFKTESPGQMG